MHRRAFSYVAGAALTVLVASPVRQYLRPRAARVDGFPLSHYPMFSAKRSDIGKVNHLMGVDSAGGQHIVHYRHAGSGGLNQVRRQITRRIRDGQAQELAEAVASSIAQSTDAAELRLHTVQVVTSRHRYAAFYAGDREPHSRRVLAEAPVRRTTSMATPNPLERS